MPFPTGPACTEQDIWRVAWRDYVDCVPRHQVLASGADGVIRRDSTWTLASASVNLSGLAGRFARISNLPDPLARSGAYNNSRVVDGDILVVDGSDAGTMTLRRAELSSGAGMAPGSTDADRTGLRFLVGYIDPQIDEATRDVDLQVYADTSADARYAEWRRKCAIWGVLVTLYYGAWQQTRDDLYAAKMNAATRTRDRLIAEFRERAMVGSFAGVSRMRHAPLVQFPGLYPFAPVSARVVADLPGDPAYAWPWPVGFPWGYLP